MLVLQAIKKSGQRQIVADEAQQCSIRRAEEQQAQVQNMDTNEDELEKEDGHVLEAKPREMRTEEVDVKNGIKSKYFVNKK
jgi:pyrroline-5-carboxylate reductase